MGCFGQKSNAKCDNKAQLQPLLYDYNQCKNIDRVTSTPGVAQNVMQFLTEACVRLIEDKQPISDDLLVLCYDYCKDYDVKEAQRLETVLKKTIRQCLREDIDSRSAEWFKLYIQSSNVLLLDSVLKQEAGKAGKSATTVKTTAPKEQKPKQNSNDNYKTVSGKRLSVIVSRQALADIKNDSRQITDSNPILADFTRKVKPQVEEKLLYAYFIEHKKKRTEKQRRHIAHKCSQLSDNSDWEKLVKFDVRTDSNNNNNNCLRQDRIYDIQLIKQRFPNANSILPELDRKALEARTAAASTGEEGKFELFRDSNQYAYLTKCLVVAHSLNDQFHSTMKHIVGKMNQEKNEFKFKAIYREADVKSRER